EEAQRGAADGLPGAGHGGARRDRQRPRHRRAENRRRRGQRAARARPLAAPDHPLPAPARLHRARPCARAVARTHRRIRRTGAGEAARGRGLRPLHRRRRGSVTMSDASGFNRLLDPDALPQGALPGSALPWLAERRAAAAERFRAHGLPHRRLEAWRYTDLPRALKDRDYVPAQRQDPVSLDAVPALLEEEPAARLTFVDGLYRPELSRTEGLPEGVKLLPLAQALEREPALLEGRLGNLTEDDGVDDPQLSLLALNAALLDDGLVLLVEPGIALEGRIELVQLGGLAERPVYHGPRHLVVLGEGARATLVE